MSSNIGSILKNKLTSSTTIEKLTGTSEENILQVWSKMQTLEKNLLLLSIDHKKSMKDCFNLSDKLID